MSKDWLRFLDSESSYTKWLNLFTKMCPKCSQNIEKNSGCNHMTCQKSVGGCGHEFCWLCLKEWRKHTECLTYQKFDQEEEMNKLSKSMH
mmetsp:Transcript_62783/g.53250  ORF Transcript_62783/g.53250 Transcript_62783/m.53250 type:complete len:90 (+) Transcript_62783:106-375(+)